MFVLNFKKIVLRETSFVALACGCVLTAPAETIQQRNFKVLRASTVFLL